MNAAASIDPVALLAPYRANLWLPRYRAGRQGKWSLEIITALTSRGYWGEVHGISGIPILKGPVADGEVAWMSIVPMEMESQEIGIAEAHGHTVVLGLGMGWCAANVALRPSVTRVTVVERDPDVIALMEDMGILTQLPADIAAKITIVQADAFDWTPDAHVDTLQADIWAWIVEPNKWDDVRALHARIRPDRLYFWGQEMEFWRLACRASGSSTPALDNAGLDAIVAGTGLPLITSQTPDRAARIAAGARWWTPQNDTWWA